MENKEFIDLMEIRLLLESHIATMAAQHRTIDDIISLKNAMQICEDKVQAGQSAIEDDLFFHLKIADAANNKTLKSLLLIIVTRLLHIAAKYKDETCAEKFENAIKEHEQIFEHILYQERELAAQAMRKHLQVNYADMLVEPLDHLV